MYKNVEMEKMARALSKHLERRDIVGYAAARNTRILQNELKEYIERRDELVRKYGDNDVDAEGNPTGSISLAFDSPNFPKFAEEIEQYATIEHSPNIMQLKYEDAIGILSGAEILELDWMFKEE
jgi:hypothetical protein